jgi:hypothetical protein
MERELTYLAQEAECHRLDQCQTHEREKPAQRNIQASQPAKGMSDEVNGTTGATNDSFDDLCLPVQ